MKKHDLLFKLSEPVEGIPVAYVDIEPKRCSHDSEEQVIVDISGIGFVPKELIFDVSINGEVLGVEIL